MPQKLANTLHIRDFFFFLSWCSLPLHTLRLSSAPHHPLPSAPHPGCMLSSPSWSDTSKEARGPKCAPSFKGVASLGPQ